MKQLLIVVFCFLLGSQLYSQSACGSNKEFSKEFSESCGNYITSQLPSGKCMECRKKKAREWQVRLSEDIKEHKNGKFITLTFDTENLIKLTNKVKLEHYKKCKTKLQGYELDNKIATYAIDKFCERWRKKYKKFPRHWLITELGTQRTEHIHLHGIIWADDIQEIS